MALADNALTLLATVKTDLGITVATYDAQLERLVNAASDAIAHYCQRAFQRDTAITEDLAGYGLHGLLLARPPVNEVTSVKVDNVTVDPDDYEIGDAEAGLLHRLCGWEWTAHQAADISGSIQPGSERKLIEVIYDGGWVTPKQAQAVMMGAPNLTFAATTPATITRAAGSWLADLFVARLPVTIAGATTPTNNGAFKIATVSALVLTLAADETLTAEGPTAACTAQVVRTLPWDLEDACINLARALWMAKRRDPDVTSEHLLSWGASYAGAEAGLPPSVARMINRFKRIGSA